MVGSEEEFLLSEKQENSSKKLTVVKQPDLPNKKMLRELLALSGMDALNRILEQKDPRRYLQQMARVDFFWLIKKIGEDDALPLLKLASPEQWQYLLDMELWRKDRIDVDQITLWLERLHRSDPGALVKWLSSHGQALAYVYLFKNIQVIMKNWDEDEAVPEDFFSLDGTYFIRILNKDHEEMIGNVLREMARNNYEQYQALILGLAGLLPAEAEEKMYRMRNVRLAEEGFLPLEEALSVYMYQKADTLLKDQPAQRGSSTSREGTEVRVPMIPLIHSQDNKFLALAVSRLEDPLFLDRIRLEFAGLCNQILSADGLVVGDFEDLIRICRKAAGYLSLGLERLTEGNLPLSEQMLKQNTLLSIFRVGFGMALELKWEAERWIKEAWFDSMGFKTDFWGEEWGPTLLGLLQRRPRFFCGDLERETYREFEQSSDLDRCRQTLGHLIALDKIFEGLTSRYPLPSARIKDPLFTFHPLLFTFWARRQLKLKPGFAPLTAAQMRNFFNIIRGRTVKPPYRMSRYKKIFLGDLLSAIQDRDSGEEGTFRETLSKLWALFADEYAWVPEEELDEKFTRFLLIESSRDVLLH